MPQPYQARRNGPCAALVFQYEPDQSHMTYKSSFGRGLIEFVVARRAIDLKAHGSSPAHGSSRIHSSKV